MIPQYLFNHSTLYNIEKWFFQCIQRSWQFDLKGRFSIHQFHTAVLKFTDIVNASPYLRFYSCSNPPEILLARYFRGIILFSDTYFPSVSFILPERKP